MSSAEEKEKDIFSDDSISHSKSPSITKSSPVNSVHTYDSPSRSRSHSPETLPYFPNNNPTKFIMKNGCCKECMRAFSKSGKSCLCQVPKSEIFSKFFAESKLSEILFSIFEISSFDDLFNFIFTKF